MKVHIVAFFHIGVAAPSMLSGSKLLRRDPREGSIESTQPKTLQATELCQGAVRFCHISQLQHLELHLRPKASESKILRPLNL